MTYGEMKTKSAKSRMKNADPGIHQRSPTGARAHDDEHREAEQDELHAEREPAAEDHLRIADVCDVVTAVPPERRDLERQLDEPDEPKASIASSIPVPIGPAAESRMNRCPYRE
jgi:hypothetical protein